VGIAGEKAGAGWRGAGLVGKIQIASCNWFANDMLGSTIGCRFTVATQISKTLEKPFFGRLI
jgi:hypothetical protein